MSWIGDEAQAVALRAHGNDVLSDKIHTTSRDQRSLNEAWIDSRCACTYSYMPVRLRDQSSERGWLIRSIRFHRTYLNMRLRDKESSARR
jgi:hypothetical protein